MPHALLPFLSFNLAVSIAAAPLAVLLAFVLLYVVTHPRFTKTPLHSKRPLTVTQHNTLLNRHENGGTGVWSRKWRRKVAAALAMAPVRRGLGDLDDPDDSDDDDDVGAGYSSSGSDSWKVKIKPAPDGLKGCLKREGSFELARLALDHRVEHDDEPSRLSPIPSPAASQSSSTSSFYSPPLPPPSPPSEPTFEPVVSKPKKSVSIQEPSLVELEHLRNLWSSEEMQSSVNGGSGFGGIAGYRRTRDYFNKTASTAPSRAPAPQATVPATPSAEATSIKSAIPTAMSTMSKEEGDSKRAGEEKENRNRRPLNSTLTGASSSRSSSSSSLSPSPVIRRPVSKRALSPNAIAVGGGAIRRRGLSPSNQGASGSGSTSSRSASSSPAPTGDRAQPRWIKTKKSNKVSTLRPPTDDEGGDDDAEGESARSSRRSGSMSATVSDEEEDGFEDVPPTPPSQHATLAPAPSPISPSLELLLNETNLALIRDERRQAHSHETEDATHGSPLSPSSSPIPHERPSLSPQRRPSAPSPSASPAVPRPRVQPETPSLQVTPASPVVSLAALPSMSPIMSSAVRPAVTSELRSEEDEEEK